MQIRFGKYHKTKVQKVKLHVQIPDDGRNE
jgi:hypothetical protein